MPSEPSTPTAAAPVLTFVIDPEAPRGNLIPALVRLLRSLACAEAVRRAADGEQGRKAIETRRQKRRQEAVG